MVEKGLGLRQGHNAFWAIASPEGDGIMTKAKKTVNAWRQLSGGQQAALGEKIRRASGAEDCQDIFQAVLAGDLEVVLHNATKKLVDANGRVIPFSGMKGEVVDANRAFHLVQPTMQYGQVLDRLATHFGLGTVLPTVEEFAAKSAELLAKVAENKQVRNLLKGVHLPIVVPQTTITDYGTELETRFLPAVESSYRAEFPGRSFKNWRKGELAGKVGVVAESRHQQFLDRLATGAVVGVYFPTALQGFSIPADLAAMSKVAPGFALTGALETAAALVAYPDVLARDYQTPGLDCAANTWSATYALLFRADVGLLVFGPGFLGAYDSCSGGLLLLG